MSGDLSRVDRLWRCTRCGYFAFSSPWYSVYDEEGREVGGGSHDCPQCGSVQEPWQWCGGLGRDERTALAAAVSGAGGGLT